jgi:proline-specific peptidase
LEDTNKLRDELPAETQGVLTRHEKAGTTDSDEYMAATMKFYKRYLCRLEPWPEELDETFANFGWDVYLTMWGPSEFHATGNLKEVDLSDRLGEILLPTMITAGRYDEATPETTAWYQSLIPGSSLEIFEESSHMTMLEQPERYTEVLRGFLRGVDS